MPLHRQLRLRAIALALRVAIYLPLLTVATSTSFAQTNSGFRYVFPQFNGNTGTELVLSNLSAQSIQATVRFYGNTGAELTNTTVVVSAGSQTRLNSTFFTAAEGSAVVESSGPLSAMATIATSGAFENAAPAPGLIDSIIPFSLGNAGKMDLTFVNGNALPTIAFLRTYAADGTPINSVQRPVAALGSLTEAFSSLFPQASLPNARDIAYLTVRATSNVTTEDRRLSVQARIRDYPDPSILTAVPASAAVPNPVLPYFVQGGNYVSTIQVVNPTGSTASVTLLPFDNKGLLLGTGTGFALAPGGSMRVTADMLFNSTAQTSGSIFVKSDVPVIATEGIANIATNAYMLTSAVAGDTNFAFSQRQTAGSAISLSLANPNASDAHVRVRSISSDGTIAAQISMTLTAQNSMTQPFTNLISDPQINGFIYITSDVPVAGSAFESNATNTILANVPQMHADPSYSPPVPTSFRIKGAVKRVGSPVAGITINMGGAQSASSLTDTSGSYVYRVSPGLFTITASDPKYVFNPPLRNISIVFDDSVGNDFEAALLGPTPQPSVTSLSPSSTTVRLSVSDPPLLLNVTGSEFVPGAQIYVNSVAMPTLFLSPTLLSASVPATALQSGGTLQVSVQNPQPTLGPSGSLPLIVTNPGPVLVTVEPATFAMTPGVPVSITLRGDNFTPGSLYELTPPCASIFVTNRLDAQSATITSNLNCSGIYYVRVRTPEPGGGVSQTLPVVVQ